MLGSSCGCCCELRWVRVAVRCATGAGGAQLPLRERYERLKRVHVIQMHATHTVTSQNRPHHRTHTHSHRSKPSPHHVPPHDVSKGHTTAHTHHHTIVLDLPHPPIPHPQIASSKTGPAYFFTRHPFHGHRGSSPWANAPWKRYDNRGAFDPEYQHVGLMWEPCASRKLSFVCKRTSACGSPGPAFEAPPFLMSQCCLVDSVTDVVWCACVCVVLVAIGCVTFCLPAQLRLP